MQEFTLDQIADAFGLREDDRELLFKIVKRDQELRAEVEAQQDEFRAWYETVAQGIADNLSTKLKDGS